MGNPALFTLGQLVMTANANSMLLPGDVFSAVSRHISGDWGVICDHDKNLNDNAVKSGGRIFSAYVSSDNQKFWVITEADRSSTTVLLPQDY